MAEHRSFTVRVPLDLYFDITKLASADDQHINVKVNQLLKLGLDRHVSLDVALRRLLSQAVTS